MLLALKFAVRRKDLYEAPKGDTPAPAVDPRPADPDLHAGLVLHGGNDGQKGMGLIMLILIGRRPPRPTR